MRLQFRGFAIVAVLAGSAGTLPAQTLIPVSGPGGSVAIFNSDAAILECQESRKDLPCDVTTVKPVLGFDLKFHSGYEVSIPLKELAGPGNLLIMIFRVTPANRPDEPVYFSQRVKVPEVEENARGEAYLQGGFEVGEGDYKIDWLMRDRAERICSSFWTVSASLPARDRHVALEIVPGAVQQTDQEPYKEEPPVERAERDGPLNVKILVNFAPQDAGAALLQPLDTSALVLILRNISREPRIGRFSVVAFNIQEQRVFYRQEGSSYIDFPALGQALNGLNLGTVDVKQLSQKSPDTTFLAALITKEMSGTEAPDAVIFAGPKVTVDSNVPSEVLKEIGEPQYPVFYMNYNLDPVANPWRDAIGNVVRYFKGLEYTISRPRDLFNAWSEIMTRIVKSKSGRQVASASSQ